MQNQDDTRAEVLSQLCTGLLILLSACEVPAAAVSLDRIETLGPHPVLILQLLLTLSTWSVLLIRNRLSYLSLAGFTAFLISFATLTGVSAFGVNAATAAWIPFGGIVGAILLGHRAGILLLASITSIASALAFATVSNGMPPPFDLSTSVASPLGWGVLVASWTTTGGIAIASLYLLNCHFVETATATRLQSEALARNQHEYRDMFQNMVDTVYQADLQGKIIAISPSIVNMLGFEPEEVKGQELAKYYVDPHKREELVEELRAHDGAVRNFEAQLYHRNGSPQWISTNVRYRKAANGELLGIEGVARNITSRKEAEEALLRSQKMEALGQLTGGIAHDFNNLLGVIIGNADLIEEDSEASPLPRQNASEIRKAANQGSALTRRLLALTRPEMMLRLPTTVDAVLRDLEGVLRRTLGTTVMLRLDLDAETDIILIDPHQFEASILNLALNARDAMPNGGEFTISTEKTLVTATEASTSKPLVPGQYVRIIVRDTGKGMSDEVLGNALEPFFTTKPLGTANGLGLSLVFGFVTQFAGQIEIASDLGSGTSVTLLLPRSGEKTKSDPDPTTSSSKAALAARILVVEDASPLRSMVATMLESQGYHVIATENGRDALDLIHSDTEINLLFSDIVLPGGVDGFEIAREAMRSRSDLKVLLTSGYAQETPPDQNGIDKASILYKPYRRSELLERVGQVLSGRAFEPPIPVPNPPT